MLEELPPPVGHDRPFPWRCSECRAKEVFPKATDYTTTRKHDGRSYTIHIPDLELPTCRKCGAQTFSVGDDDRIWAALRLQVGLLTPEAILKGRSHLKMTQQQLADQLGIAKETVCRWESGAIQSRAMDNLLRLFFESEEVRRLLRERFAPEPPVSTGPKCPECEHGYLVSFTRDEEFDYDLGQQTINVLARNVPVERCDSCGMIASGPAAAKVRDQAVSRASRMSKQDTRGPGIGEPDPPGLGVNRVWRALRNLDKQRQRQKEFQPAPRAK